MSSQKIPTAKAIQNDHTLSELQTKASELRLGEKAVRVSDIKIIDANRIAVDSIELSFSKRGKASFLRSLGLNEKSSTSIFSAFGKKGTEAMNMIKDAQSGTEVLLKVDRDRNIQAVAKAKDSISFGSFFSLLKGYLNTDDFEIKYASIDQFGCVKAHLIPYREHSVHGMDTETFRSGVVFSYDGSRLNVDQGLFRLICSNGAETPLFLDTYTLDSPKEVQPWLAALAGVKASDYGAAGYISKLKEAASTQASFREVINVNDRIASYVEGDLLDRNLAANSFSGYLTCANAYETAKIENVNGVAALLRSDRTVWDLHCALTDLASHDYTNLGFNITEDGRSDLKRYAGHLLCSAHDLRQGNVKQVF